MYVLHCTVHSILTSQPSLVTEAEREQLCREGLYSDGGGTSDTPKGLLCVAVCE